MRWSLLVLAGTFVVAAANAGSSQAPTIEGLWKARTQTVYRFVQRGSFVVATYEIPNAAQTAAGIVTGDLALKGSFIANVLSGTYYQRAPLAVQETCPEFKIIDGPVQWELKDNAFAGTLMLIGGSDEDCTVSKRILSQVHIERLSEPIPDRKEPSPAAMPPNWPSPW